jgi:hypothetical protein
MRDVGYVSQPGEEDVAQELHDHIGFAVGKKFSVGKGLRACPTRLRSDG